MKKFHLSLALVLILSASCYFLSCNKESALLLPAVQKIRQAANAEWKVFDKSVLELNVALSEKIKAEYQDYATDSNIVVACRIKFKGQDEEHLLPYAVPAFGGTKYYFYTFTGGKLKILFVNSQGTDFSGGGVAPALPVEEISLNFTKIEH